MCGTGRQRRSVRLAGGKLNAYALVSAHLPFKREIEYPGSQTGCRISSESKASNGVRAMATQRSAPP